MIFINFEKSQKNIDSIVSICNTEILFQNIFIKLSFCIYQKHFCYFQFLTKYIKQKNIVGQVSRYYYQKIFKNIEQNQSYSICQISVGRPVLYIINICIQSTSVNEEDKRYMEQDNNSHDIVGEVESFEYLGSCTKERLF